MSTVPHACQAAQDAWPTDAVWDRIAESLRDEFELDRYEPSALEADELADQEDTTLADVFASIDTNLWLAECYYEQGAEGLAAECLRAARRENQRFWPWLFSRDRDQAMDLSRRIGALLEKLAAPAPVAAPAQNVEVPA